MRNMYTKKIYFSGGSFHELQEVFSRVKGVVSCRTVYITAAGDEPTYESVLKGEVDAAMGVEIEFNPKKIDLSSLMDILFTVINPYSEDKQGECEGHMYRNGVYYVSAEDAPIISYFLSFIQNRKKIPAATDSALIVNDPNSDPAGTRVCHVEALRLKSFHPAEDEHQDFLRRFPLALKKTYIDFVRLKELSIIE